MKIYLDDERNTPSGWHRTYSVQETIELLKTRQVTHLSLDNDLGDLDKSTEGFNVLLWLEEEVFNDFSFPIPEIAVHSSNSARVEYMNRIIKNIYKIRLTQQERL